METNDTKKIINKSLCDKMPYLIPRDYRGEILKDYDYEYVNGEYDLPKGWHKLFMQMCMDIRQPLIDSGCIDKFRFVQIKEKYNSMRCYNYNATQEVADIIDKYEHLSRYVCQCCGKPATKETYGWITSYCDDCLPEDTKADDIIFDPIMKIRIYKNDEGICEKKIDCSEEWKRLYNVVEVKA